MNRQRHAVYGDRRKVLEGADVESRLRATVDTVVEQYVIGATEGFAEDWDLEQLWSTMNTLYPVSLVRAEYESATTSTGRCWSMTSRLTPKPRTTSARRALARRSCVSWSAGYC